MATQGYIPKSELFDWLRQSVRRRENVALKILTDPQRDTITLRLSDGRLVYVSCEGHGPLDALVLLAECEQVRFNFTSAPASERRELMSPDAFVKWLDTAGAGDADVREADPDPSPGASDGERWSGTLRSGRVRSGRAGKGRAGVTVAAAVVAVVAVVGLLVAGGALDDESGVAPQPGPTAHGSSTQIEESGAVLVRGPVVETMTLRTGRTYRLDGLVFVEAGALLIMEPGVTVLGETGAALVVTRDASIHARGTASAPIVFTSARPEGTRASGDWGGVVLLGNAPVNRGQANVEGIPRDDGRGVFGGNDRRSSCGVLEYVRIEFAGYPIGADNELNGLTLGGCGSETLVRHVQVHRSHDDGIEVFGGVADLKYVLLSHAGDDALDWDMGWTGRAQFLVVQQHPELGDAGFEGDSSADDPGAEPISRPRIYNVTMVGSGSMNRPQRAMVIRNGSGGEFRNFLIAGFPLEPIDLRGEPTAGRIASGALSFGSIVMSAIGADAGGTYFADEWGAGDDDGGFDERRYFSEVAPDIVLDAPQALGPEARSLTDPDFTPVAAYIGAGSQWSLPPNEEFWDEAASYYGAVRYGERTNWMHGWTAWPES